MSYYGTIARMIKWELEPYVPEFWNIAVYKGYRIYTGENITDVYSMPMKFEKYKRFENIEKALEYIDGEVDEERSID